MNILLNEGAQINENVLLWAVNIEILECLLVKLNEGPEDQKIRLLNNFFVSNVCLKNKSLIQWVLTKGIDINYKNLHGQTALMLAASKNSFMLVQFLLENNASIHERDNQNNTALLYAVSHFPNHYDMIEFLLSKGASIQDKNYFGDTPVTIAAKKGLTKTLSLLLHSSNISSNDKNIVKALQGALDNQKSAAAGVLIDFGAPLNFNSDHLGKLRKRIMLKIKESLRTLSFGWGSFERYHHNTHMENYAKASAEAVYHTALPDVLSGLVNEYLFRDNPLLLTYKQRWHELSLSVSPVQEKIAVASNEDNKKHKREDKEMVLRSSKRYCQITK